MELRHDPTLWSCEWDREGPRRLQPGNRAAPAAPVRGGKPEVPALQAARPGAERGAAADAHLSSHTNSGNPGREGAANKAAHSAQVPAAYGCPLLVHQVHPSPPAGSEGGSHGLGRVGRQKTGPGKLDLYFLNETGYNSCMSSTHT